MQIHQCSGAFLLSLWREVALKIMYTGTSNICLTCKTNAVQQMTSKKTSVQEIKWVDGGEELILPNAHLP